jgi:hypothetical protein
VRKYIHHDSLLVQTTTVKNYKNVEKDLQLFYTDQEMTIIVIQESGMDEKSLHQMLMVNLQMCYIMIKHQQTLQYWWGNF